MRTHDEILKEAFIKNDWPEYAIENIETGEGTLYAVIKHAIRQAQIEAIKECAEVSGAELQINDMHVAAAMVKNKILQLKNQVK